MSVQYLPSGNGRGVYRVRRGREIVAQWSGPELSPEELAEKLAELGVAAPAVAAATGRPTICVALTCHRDYLHWLPGAIDSIDQQADPADQKILCLDACEPSGLLHRPDWTIIRGQWGSPIPGRNLALDACACDWIVGWDADNVMPEDFLSGYRQQAATVGRQVAILYPDLQYTDADLVRTRLRDMPEVWDLREMRRKNCVDTSSCWRVDALRAIGGYPETTGLDDLTAACALTAEGWTCEHAHVPPVLMREHSLPRRSATTGTLETSIAELWGIRSLGVVTLLAPGRQAVQKLWLRWLQQADLPPHLTIYVVDNTGDPATRKWLAKGLAQFADVVYLRDDRTPDGPDWRHRHQHVARLYRRAFARVTDDLVLTVEDDVIPPLDAARRLMRHYNHCSQAGAVCAVYACPENPTNACASWDGERWFGEPPLATLEPRLYEVGLVGGGCTLYGSWALRQAMPVECWERPEHPLGWDAMLCYRLRQAGWRILLDGSVRCEHHIHGEVKGA